MTIPLQSSCNMDDPEEHFLWMLVALAGPSSHAPLVVPVPVLRRWSKHLYDAGARWNPELQTIKYLPPAAGTNWVTGAAGEWVPIDTPLTPEQTAPDISHLSDDEKIVLLRHLLTQFQPVQEVPDVDE